MNNSRKLEKFVKVKVEREPMVTTSVMIEKRQLAFLHSRALNLSALVRNLLERLMKDSDAEIDVE
jgi:hypothetical protein